MNSLSGVTLDPSCIQKFDQIKLKHQLRYCTYKIVDRKTIQVDDRPEAEGDKTKTFDDFTKSLPEDQPRYCVVDVEYITKSGADHSKIVFILWCPDNAGVKDKMLYAASKDTISKSLQGCQLMIQANDHDDLKKEGIQQKLVC